MSRGVLYIIWRGTSDPTAILNRSIASLKHWHPELPYHVAELPPDSDLRCKSRMFELSPFGQTLFLDADTTVLGRLDYGFTQSVEHGMALCISANPWQRRYSELPGEADAVEYSSGVVFFSKTHPKVRDVFDEWYAANDLDSSTRYASDDGIREQNHNDQALMTLALYRAGLNPFVLPLNWNLFPKWQKSFFGPVKILHGYDDIPQSLLAWNEEQSRPGAVIRCVSLP